MPSSLRLANNGTSRLAALLSDSATSLSVLSGDGAKFPSLSAGQFFPATIVRSSDQAIEIVRVTARSSDTFTITRAQEGTTALAFAANDLIELRLTASTFADEVQRVEDGALQKAGINETVFTITDGASVDLNPANGTVQLWTLGANRTPTATSFAAGQSMTLMVDDGTARTITWTTIGVVWVGGSAPTLPTSGYGVIELWKVSTTIYGAYVGAVA
jgi:hypothetical protein